MAAPSEAAVYLNGTFMHQNDSGYDTSIVASCGFPEEVTNAAADRVIPQLVKDVATHTHVRQRMHLQLFADHLDDFIAYDDTTDQEWEMLLVMLFSLMRRRGGLTPMQKQYNEDVSDLCFEMLSHLLSSVKNVKFPDVLKNLKVIMSQLDCTSDRFYERGENAPEPNEEAISPPSIDLGNEEDIAKEIAELEKILNTSHGALAEAEKKGKEAHFATHPWWYTVDSVDPKHRIGFTEKDFQATKEWFYSCESDPSDSTGLKRMVVRGMQSTPNIGYKHCPPAAIAEFQSQFPAGAAELIDLLRFLFRQVPERVLIRRVNGVVLTDGIKGWYGRAKLKTGASITAAETFRLRLIRFFAHYTPYKLNRVDSMLTKWQGREEAMFNDLVRQYGPEPMDPEAAFLAEEAASPATGTGGPAITPVTEENAKCIPRVPLHVSQDFLAQQRTGQVSGSLTLETAVMLREWWDYVLFHQEDGDTAQYATADAIHAANHAHIGDWTIDAAYIVQSKGGQDMISFQEVVRYLFPLESGAHIRAVCREATNLAKDAKRLLDAQRACEDDLFKTSPGVGELKAPRSCGGPDPEKSVGQIENKEMDAVLTNMMAALEKAYAEKEDAKLKLAVKKNNQKVLEVHAQEVLRNFEEYHRKRQETCVPTLHSSPMRGPREQEMYGFKVKSTMLLLDDFLHLDGGGKGTGAAAAAATPKKAAKPGQPQPLDADRAYRTKVVGILQTLDWSGVPVGYFLSEPNALHRMLPFSFTQPCRVFRDFAFCTKRPSANTFWQGNHVLHIKTNITKHSDTKYRFLLEGYNFGVNAPVLSNVCGYAGTKFEHVDKLESYGWPDCWDHNTIQNHGKGIAGIRQYFSADGFVVLRCEAKSFSCVGFSISAWLCCHQFGQGFVPNCDVFHQDDPL